MKKVLILSLPTDVYQQILFHGFTDHGWHNQLIKLLDRPWRADFDALSQVTYAVSFYCGVVIADYYLGSTLTIERKKKSISDLQLTSAYNETGLSLRYIKYRPERAATIQPLDKLIGLIQGNDRAHFPYDYTFDPVLKDPVKWGLYTDHSRAPQF